MHQQGTTPGAGRAHARRLPVVPAGARTARRKRGLAGALGALLVLALAVMTQASASQLTLTGAQLPHVQADTRCDDAVDATTPTTASTSTTVNLTGIAAACAGLSVRVTVYDPATGTAKATGTAPATTLGTLTVPTAAYTPSTTDRVSLTIDSWPVATAWTYAAPVASPGCVIINNGGNVVQGKSCSLVYGANSDGSGTRWNVKVTVTTTYSGPLTWRATIDFADLARFPFAAKYVGEYSGGAVVAPLGAGFCSGSSRLVTITGSTTFGWDTIGSGTPHTLDFVGANTAGQPNPVYSCP